MVVGRAGGERVRGRVASFDDPRGIGTVTDETGDHEYPFHCTAIADGTRTIEVGAAIDFVVVAGRLGRWEAADLQPRG